MKAIVLSQKDANTLMAACSFGAAVLRQTASLFPPEIAASRHQTAAELDQAMRLFCKFYVATGPIAILPAAPDVPDEPLEVMALEAA